eukprot:2305202-Prymnesium_polylepis.1
MSAAQPPLRASASRSASDRLAASAAADDAPPTTSAAVAAPAPAACQRVRLSASNCARRSRVAENSEPARSAASMLDDTTAAVLGSQRGAGMCAGGRPTPCSAPAECGASEAAYSL